MNPAESHPATRIADAPVLHEWSMDCPMTYRSVALSRTHARRRLVMWRWPGDAEDAVVMVSELVTNAISHGRVVGYHLRLRLAALEDGTLLIDVSDPFAEFPNFGAVPGPRLEQECGRGLLVIRCLGGRVSWFLRQDAGKTVRARVAPAYNGVTR